MPTARIPGVLNLINSQLSDDDILAIQAGGSIPAQTTLAALGSYFSGSTQYWKVVDADYDALPRELLNADTSGGTFTITLPQSPDDGVHNLFNDLNNTWPTNNLIIAGGLNLIEGADNLICDRTFSFALVFAADLDQWQFRYV